MGRGLDIQNERRNRRRELELLGVETLSESLFWPEGQKEGKGKLKVDRLPGKRTSRQSFGTLLFKEGSGREKEKVMG